MRRIYQLVIAFGCLATCAVAQPEQNIPVSVFGWGKESCTAWLSSPTTFAGGGNWVFGYWSARNERNESNHQVGNPADGNAILNAVREVCAAEPTIPLISAVNRAYSKMEEASRI